MLNRRQKYLQIALNNSLSEAQNIIHQLPIDKRIIIEAGTPLIKAYGVMGIRRVRSWWEQKIFGVNPETPQIPGTRFSAAGLLVKAIEKGMAEKQKRELQKKEETLFTPYIVVDLKCMDRGEREVRIAVDGGANAAVALGQAPIETLDAFIKECENHGLDSMVDMMNVDYPLNILRKLKKIPQVIILHRGVDEEHFNREKEIPFHEIQLIKGNYDVIIAIAGGDTFREVQRALFNDADIVIVWKSFYKSSAETAKLAEEFLKEIR